MVEKLFAGIVLLGCVVLMVRLLLGPRRRARFDARARHAWHDVVQRARLLRHWRSSRREAQRVADEAIRRARGEDVERDGNVYRPKSFRKPPRDKMH